MVPHETTLSEDGVRLRNMRKYPSTTTADDNVPVIRIEEVVLNLAEAMFELNDGQALATLNSIPSNRGATPYTSVTKDNIIMERRKELMFEGFRFDDMMRTGMNALRKRVQRNQRQVQALCTGPRRLPLSTLGQSRVSSARQASAPVRDAPAGHSAHALACQQSDRSS